MGQVVSQQLENLQVPQQRRVAENCPFLAVDVEQRVSEIAHQLQESDLAVANGPEHSLRRGGYDRIFFLEDLRFQDMTSYEMVYLFSRA